MKLPAFRSQHVDGLNLGLIALSLLLAYQLPFQLFLFVYAILGPLHYLTEINWLHERKYFIASTRWLLVPGLVALLIFVSKLVSEADWITNQSDWVSKALQLTGMSSNGLVFWWLLISVGLVTLRTWRHRLLIAALGLAVSLVLLRFPGYILLAGLMLPTVIHVYLFTALFMLYGAQKSNSRLGYLSVAALTLVPIAIAFLPLDPTNYHFADTVKTTFLESNFHITNTKIAGFLGFSEGKSFFFYEVMEIKFQVFVAFAYTYHYLNWFSKTTTIGWHRQLTATRTLIIAALWLTSVALYAWDYSMGLVVLIFLSTLHVLLEFPLNIISIREIGRKALSSLTS